MCVHLYALAAMQGKVYRARNVETGEIVAAKLLDQDAVRRNARVFANLEREITAMQRLTGHPHVVGVKTVVYDVNKPRKRRPGAFRRQIMIVMELAPGGPSCYFAAKHELAGCCLSRSAFWLYIDGPLCRPLTLSCPALFCAAGELFQYLMLSKFPEPMARAYFSQMMEALAYAHNKGVAHRDLKPENLLLDAGYGLRVADWGLSAVADDIARAALRTQCGTVRLCMRDKGRGLAGLSVCCEGQAETTPNAHSVYYSSRCCFVSTSHFPYPSPLSLPLYPYLCLLQRAYMAPEVLRGAAYSGEAADVWSAGVILFIFLAGFPPFQEAAAGDWWAERIMEGNYPLFWMAHGEYFSRDGGASFASPVSRIAHSSQPH